MPADVVPFPSQNIVRDTAEQRRVARSYTAALRRKGATPEKAWEAAAAEPGPVRTESAVHRAIRLAKETRYD